MNIIQPASFGRVTLESGEYHLCPIMEGTRVYWGWRKLLWRTVVCTGKPSFVHNEFFGEGWLVPVRFRFGAHALLVYRYGRASQGVYDAPARIVDPDTASCARHIRRSVMMPRITALNGGVVAMCVSKFVPADNEEYTWTGEEKHEKYFEVRLHGVIGPRREQRDSVELVSSDIAYAR